MSDNHQYIPKYISKVPWYHKTGPEEEEETESTSLAHQYKDPNVKEDHSKPKAGSGVKDEFATTKDNIEVKVVDDWDSKRDRWHGFDVKEWDKVVQNWDSIKKGTLKSKSGKSKNRPGAGMGAHNNRDVDAANSSDDSTDYELELTELGLEKKDIVNKMIEDPLEKILRDRQDVPHYILNISAQEKLKYDPQNRNITNDQNDFIPHSSDRIAGETTSKGNKINRKIEISPEIQSLQNFAKEQHSESERQQHQRLLQKRLNGEMEGEVEVDLDLSLVGNPTEMLLKARKQANEKETMRQIKKSKLNERYG